VPLALLSIKEHDPIGWINPPSLASLRLLIQDYLGVPTVVTALVAGCAVAALLPPLPQPGTWRLRPRAEARAGERPAPAWWRSGGVSLPSVAAPLLVLPAAILLIESRLLHPLYVDRYVLYGEAGAALLAGAGLYRIGRWVRERAGRRLLVWVPGAVVCLCVLVLQLAAQHHIRTPESRRYDFGGPSQYVALHSRPGDGIIFFGQFYRKARLGYPADFRKTRDFAMAVSPLRAGDLQGTDRPFRATLPLMLHYLRIWVYGGRPFGRHKGLLRNEALALRRYFTLIRRRPFHGILVTLWLRR
jgi:mannosyltransferase